MAYISKSIQDNHIVTIDDGEEVIYMKFHLAPLSMTLKGQIEVRHISEGCNLEPLPDTAKFIINDG